MYHKPKVSIIIPCYNSQAYLQKAVDSAVNQSLKEIEIILIDDGSTDKTPTLLQQYKMSDNRVEIINHSTNKGLAISRNSGIEQAKGEYLFFLDSDDYIHPNTMEVLYEQAKKEDLDILQSKYFLKNKTTKKVLQEDFVPLAKPIDGISYFHQNFFVSPMACGKLFNTEFIRNNNIKFPDRYYEDMTFVFEAVSKAERVNNNMMPTYVYQLRDDSISQNYGLKNVEDYKQVLQELQSYFLNPKLTDKHATFPVHYYLFLTRFSEKVIQNCSSKKQKEIKEFVEKMAKKYKQFISTNKRYPFLKRMILQKSPYTYALLSMKYKKRRS